MMKKTNPPVSPVPKTFFGQVGVFGRTNAGKSTLVNRLVGEMVSIVSARPQTTRNRILGILTRGPHQVVFCDTPGLHSKRTKLDEYMRQVVEGTLSGLDLGLYLVDAEDAGVELDREYLQEIFMGKRFPLFLVLNKCDRVHPAEQQRIIEDYTKQFTFQNSFAISATEGTGVSVFLQVLSEALPPGKHHYSADDYTTQTERELASEIIREEILLRYRHEIPHGTSVIIDEFQDRENGKTLIKATLHVEKESHKKIIIGKGGEEIKQLGMTSRQRLNELLGRDIYLELWVKVLLNWRKTDAMVRRMGYKPT